MTTFEGKDGIERYRLITIKAGLKLYVKSGMIPNRSWTLSKMLRAAGEFTGKVYPRSARGAEDAVRDLQAIFEDLVATPKEPENRGSWVDGRGPK